MGGTTLDRLYGRLFDAATEGLIVVDGKGEIYLVNPRVSELFGYSKEELLGEKVDILIPKSSRQSHKKMRQDYTNSPERRAMGRGRELYGERKDGTTFPVEISLNPCEVDGNRFVMALVTDITERKKAEEKIKSLNEELERKVQLRTKALEESQLLYKEIARNFPRGTINVIDKDYNYVFVEGKELFKLGIDSESLIGENYLDRLPDELSGLIRERLEKVFEGKDQSFDIEYNDSSYTISAVPLHYRESNVDKILMVESNITEMKLAQEEMRTALEKEKDLNEMKSRFVSMASHEFRTPLSTILSSSSLLERYNESDLPDKRLKHIKRIKNQVMNLTNILNDVLSLSKLEEGVVDPVLEKCNMEDFVMDLVDDVEGLKKKGQSFSFDIKGACNEIRTDTQILKNIMLNLLSNAIKYSGQEGVINLELDCKPGNFVFSVSDNGIGIPVSEQDRMFERFFRAGNVTNIEGTGLGLNIVKRYVDLLNGEIYFKSSAEEGTQFTVTLPNIIE